MAVAVRVNRVGGPDVMTLGEVAQSAPGHGEAWVEQAAIGVNYLDVTQRKGNSPLPLPSGLGLEAAGRISAVGAGVDSLKVGDRVAYATGPIGAYASGRLFPANRLVRIPDSLTFIEAASVLFKGITAQYLLKSTYHVTHGSIVVIYGAGGAVGQLMVPWAKYLGATVIGIVSKQSSVERAEVSGCDHVLVFDASTLAASIGEITRGRKADVVYDPVGKVSFSASLDSLRPRGTLVSFGASSGSPTHVSMETLNAKGSLFVTRPSIAAHTAAPEEYRRRADDVLAAANRGIITPRVWKTYALQDVVSAHSDIEDGKSEGAVVLTP